MSIIIFQLKESESMRVIVKIFSIFLSLVSVYAEVKMPKIFSDGMVLQRDIPVKIWGEAEPNSGIEVCFNGQALTTKTSASGKWSVFLEPMGASKKPEIMAVLENGKNAKIIKDVLVGEVWIASGQSNMELPLSMCDSSAAVRERADYPMIRYFYQPQVISRTPQKDSPNGSHWFACTGRSAQHMSGVAFHFAEALMKDLDVPVGILYSASGATEMAAWLPLEYASKSPYLEKYVSDFLKEVAGYDAKAYQKALAEYNQRTAEFEKKCEAAKRENRKAPIRQWDDLPPNEVSPRLHFKSPTFHYNTTISPIVGYGIRGVIWYQGEADSRDNKRGEFARTFKILVDSWRGLWNMPEMPFLYVQLASFAFEGDADGDKWAQTRWIQSQCLKEISHSGMANIIDTGLKDNIHPTDKETVGLRLEKIALKDVYGKKGISAYGPAFNKAKYFDDKVELLFYTFGGKLTTKGEPRGFELKINGKWEKGIPEVKGARKVVVRRISNDGKIEGVRYLWKNWASPDVWLYNDDSLPALSFINERALH